MEVQAKLLKVRFRNEENGYTVADFEAEGEPIVGVGQIMEVREGQKYILEGDWVYHDRFGEQFRIDRAQEDTPKTREEIQAYLASGLFPHVGPALAKRIVDRFGDRTLEVMEASPEKLKEVSGIGPVKYQAISEAAKEVLGDRELVIGLQRVGLSSGQALRVRKHYGDRSLEVVSQDPYQLIQDIPGVGFQTADRIATQNQLRKDSPERIAAGIDYWFRAQAMARGHCYVPEDLFIRRVADLLELAPEAISAQVDYLVVKGLLRKALARGKMVIYPEKLYRAEERAAAKIIQLVRAPVDPLEIEDPLESLVDLGLSMDFAPEQAAAIRGAMVHPVMIVTGGPGTGKTTILRAILALFKSVHLQVALAAPTGRAAKRMEESTGEAAQTIHRLLGFKPAGEEDMGDPDHDEDNPLAVDALILDEVSMMDLELTDRLLQSVEPGTRIIFVGDADQLPSVGAGNVLYDLLASGVIPSVRLDRVFRQDQDSMIATNAHRIKEGRMPEVNGPGTDFFFMRADQGEEAADLVVSLMQDRLPQTYGFDPREDIQVLCPMKRGEAGVEKLNDRLQAALNPRGAPKKPGDFQEGDKVMQVKNNYQLTWRSGSIKGEGIFNGDMGRVVFLDEEDGALEIEVEDKTYAYDVKQKRDLQLAYAMTIHKSQGSEFPCVILALDKASPLFLTRNLLYTAITRAKSLVVIVGPLEVLRRMVQNNRIQARYTALDEQILRFKQDYERLYGQSD